MKFYLRRIYLTREGYTPGRYGRYFGVGAPLYQYESDNEGDHNFVANFVRASDREDAKKKLAKMYPGATFYR